MTAHDHRHPVPGCYRCELDADELQDPTPPPMTERRVTGAGIVVSAGVPDARLPAAAAALRTALRNAGDVKGPLDLVLIAVPAGDGPAVLQQAVREDEQPPPPERPEAPS